MDFIRKTITPFLNKQFLSYVLIGIFNTAWGYGLIFFLMYVVHLSPVLSNAISYAFGLFVTYFLNRKITFKSKNNASKEIVRFFTVFIVAYSVNLLALVVSIDVLHIHEGVSQVIAGAFYVMTSFTGLKLYVYVTK